MRVFAGVEALSLTEQGSGYLLKNRATIEIDGHQKPACVAEMLSLVVVAA